MSIICKKLLPVVGIRGGARTERMIPFLSRNEFNHQVMYSILANTVAYHLMRSIELLIAAERRKRIKAGIVLTSQQKIVLAITRHGTALLLGFFSYLIVYILTGFVPMGFVFGSDAIIDRFEPPNYFV